VQVSCIEAVLYEEKDPEILKKVRTMPCLNRVEKSPTFRRRFIDKYLKRFR
jgi:hypothetical protein